MDPDRWQRVNNLFQEVIAREVGDRPTFLATACGGDEALRLHVERLVRAHERAAGFLTPTAFAGGSQMRSLLNKPTTAIRQFGEVEPETSFQGTPRFTVLQRLGAGGMGVVYAVRDQTRNEVVALKTFRRSRATDVYRIKREFRSLADIAHPNLVCMYELVVEAEQCFYTMELVNGVGVAHFVRPPALPDDRTVEAADRARSVLRQLVSGLSELHRHGKLHRDIKPSNVLVTSAGRVVILDFSLISSVMLDDEQRDEATAGTPPFLAPELYEGGVPSEASDWYAAGTTLYEALTGRLPFAGSSFDSYDKITRDPPPPAAIEPGVPDDLNAICIGLLSRNPARRFTARDILERLSMTPAIGHPADATPFPRKSTFVGRHHQLEALRKSFAGIGGRRAAAVYVHGPSGIGKTTLAQHFLDELVAGHKNVVVLRGRCYERESVPYKALDGIIDSLSSYLSSLPLPEAASFLPDDVGALARAFPAVLRIEAAARIPRPDVDNRDPADQRRLAVSALRQLLTNIGSQRPLVLHIDDLHWADADSALILETLLSPPDPPPVLLIACLRTEEIASKPFLQRLMSANASAELAVEPLTETEASEVIAGLAASELSVPSQRSLAREAGGNPFLLEQLARHVSSRDDGATGQPTFAGVLERRLRGLPDEARRFLEVLAVCGRPMAPELVFEAAGFAGDERPLVAILRADRLLRNSGSALRIEMYHDRIRETMTTRLSPDDTRDIHRMLIGALNARDPDDAEGLFEHYLGTGDREGASRQAVRSAQKAHDALAFDRAALWYRSALDLAPQSPDIVDWKQRLAESLVNAGRPRDAADTYLEAAHEAPRARQIDLQSRAADQLLIGGHVDRGLDVIRDVLGEVGVRFPRSRGATIASFLLRRVQLRWRGLTFTPREADRVLPGDLLRIDTCFAVSKGLMLVDNLLSADFHTRQLLLALEAGDPYRISCALSGETILFAGDGGPAASHTAWLIERNRKLAETVGHPYPIALCVLSDGVVAFLAGEWRRAAMECDRALTMFRTQCIGASWETNCAQYFLFGSRLYRGELPEINRHLASLLAAAREHGQLLFQTELCMRMGLAWLAADDPEAVQQQADEGMLHWSHRGFHRQHYNHVLTSIQVHLYCGRAEQAWQLIAGNWASIKRTMLLRIQWTRLEAFYARARCALLMAAAGRDVQRFLGIVRQDVRRIERENMPWSNPLALTLAAAAAHIEKRSDDARTCLAASIAGFERADMLLYAAVSRRRLGELTTDDSGGELIRQADGWMAARGVRNPARMARLIAPGFLDPDV